MHRLWENLSRVDTFLLAGGLLAAVIYATVLPRVSPDAMVERTLSTDRILEIGDSFVRARGGSTEALTPAIRFVRELEVLEASQNRGRKRLEKVLRNGILPGYSFEIQYREFDSDAAGLTVTDRYYLKITPDGKVWHYEDKEDDGEDASPAPPGEREIDVDRAALWASLVEDSTYAGFLPTILSWDDSTLVRRITLDRRAFAQPNQLPPEADVARSRGNEFRTRTFSNSQVVTLRPENMIAIARRYVEPMTFLPGNVVTDSVWIERGNRAAAKFQVADDSAGIVETLEAVVSPVGTLTELKHSFSSIAQNAESDRRESRLQSARQVIVIGVYFLLALVLLVVFFRQLMTRALDVKAALVDSVMFSIAFVAFILLSAGLYRAGLPAWAKTLGIVAALGIGGGVMALVVFLTSASVDSLARRSWSRKLLNVSLVRQWSVLNSFVGSAIVRGVVIGLIALGISTILLAVFSDSPLALDSQTIISGFVQPASAALGFSVWSAYFRALMLIMVVAALAYKPGRPMLVVVLPIAVVFSLGSGTGAEFSSVWLSWLAGGAIGLVFALAFWYFDLFVCFVGLIVYSLMAALQEGWLMDGSPYLLDAWLGLVAVLGMLAVGFVGISRGRPSGSNLEYVPQYIKELGEQQQLQRELQIAREVQESFLPKEMPLFDDLDIAATCIPAEQVGGDYYDFVTLSSNRLGVALGDVSGKGIQAAFFMTLTKGFLRSSSRDTESPALVLEKVNSLFRDSAPRGTFISLVYGVLDTATSSFKFGRAGHNPVILKRHGEPDATLIQPSGLGIGLASETAFASSIEETTVSLNAGDIIVLFTDGFSEARNGMKEEYGDDRLSSVVAENASGSAASIVSAVCEDVVTFCGSESTHDDRTVMVIKVGRPSDT